MHSSQGFSLLAQFSSISSRETEKQAEKSPCIPTSSGQVKDHWKWLGTPQALRVATCGSVVRIWAGLEGPRMGNHNMYLQSRAWLRWSLHH